MYHSYYVTAACPVARAAASNAISLGKFLTSRFAGGPGAWPQQRQAEHANQWFGFELKDDHPTRG